MRRRDFARLSALALGGAIAPWPRLWAAPLSAARAAPGAAPVTLRVMSFNIRYGTAADGDNHWDRRKEFLVELLREQMPDVIGVQEALYPQLEYILRALPGYAMVGVGRDDGVRAGEYACIIYRTAALTVSRSDTFWFSDTPERVASASWGNRITRICTWAQFTTPDGRAINFYNVHLDHESQPSREKSVALLRARMAARDPQAPVLVTGDFNAGEMNPAVIAMREGNLFRDTFRVVQPSAAPVGTFTAFKHGEIAGDKIDYVFASPEWEVLEAAIVRSEREGRYPSDHFPVTAVVRLRE
jgi:endonuclease/exonuclease/phosphatase family metal-dependent hydrolase